MRRRTWVAIAVAAVLGTLAAAAAERIPEREVGSTALRLPVPLDTHAMNAILRADRDKDGTLSREELEQYDMGLAKRFREVDADHDDRLTLYEFEKLLAAPEASASR
jgi:hypothetical protein